MERVAAMTVFMRVVDAKSFSKAAQQLKLTQSTVSKAVTELERRLGTSLLLRSTHGLTATDAGRAFYERARLAVEAVEAAEVLGNESGTVLSGRLRIAAAVTFARLHLVSHLGPFLKSHPKLRLELFLDDGVIDMVSTGIDIAIRMGDLGNSALTAHKIGVARRLVIGTPSYFASAGEPKKPADLAAHSAILYDAGGGGSNWTFRKGAEQACVTIDGPITTTAAEGIREAVFADLGFAIASTWMFASELASGRVRAVLTDWTLPPLDLWAVHASNRRFNAKYRAFVDLVVALLPPNL